MELESSRPRVVLGLLGGIASGKTHVARTLATLTPVRIVDADSLAHEALDQCARDGRLAAHMGPEYVTEEGTADRGALAAEVFANPARLRRLERLVHPMVMAAIRHAIQNHRRGEGPPVLVLDVPLLIEVGLDRRCDALWFVQVPETLRLERAQRLRGLSAEEVARRERAQSPLRRKRARADCIIHNDVTEAALREQLRGCLDSVGVPTTAAG